MKYPDISFIILTWNSEKYIEKCILSIKRALFNPSLNLSYEIFIVDNSSKDDTLSILKLMERSFPGNLHLIMLDRNFGTTYSRNLGLKRAKGNYICIMDSDVEISEGVVEKLIYLLSENCQIGLAVPKIVYPSGTLQKSTDKFPTIARKIYRYFFLKQIEFKEALIVSKSSYPKEPFKVDYAISAFWFMPKTTLHLVGLLDEKIFYSPEDVDYCMRIWDAGLEIYYDPSVQVVHHTQEISRGFKINSAFINHVKGLIYYFMKHRFFFSKRSFSSLEQKHDKQFPIGIQSFEKIRKTSLKGYALEQGNGAIEEQKVL